MIPYIAATEAEGESSATYYSWVLPTGELVESSVIHIPRRDIPYIICLPNTALCRMGCFFCAMPQASKVSPVAVDSLWAMLQHSITDRHIPTQYQVSFMGQGEPFDNLENLRHFCGRLVRETSEPVIGISTVGVAAGIRAICQEPWATSVKLQLSVHALPAAKRRKLVLAERLYPIDAALDAAREFCEKNKTRCCLAYVLIDGVNDSGADAEALAAAAHSGPFYVKLSRLNPTSVAHLRPSPWRAERGFAGILKSQGIDVRVFQSLGTSIGAGCGQTRLGRQVGVRTEVDATPVGML